MADRVLITQSPAIPRPSPPTTVPTRPAQPNVPIPHFDLPFRFVGSAAVVVEQDTLDDVLNCTEAAVRTERGQRKELPTFGISDPTFNLQPLDARTVIAQINEHEGRADMTMLQNPRIGDLLAVDVSLRVSSNIDAARPDVQGEG